MTVFFRLWVDAKVLVHVLVVFCLASFRTQIKAKFINHFDAVVTQPVVPTIRADIFIDFFAKFILERWCGKLPGSGT